MAQAHYAFLSDQLARKQWAQQSGPHLRQITQAPNAATGGAPVSYPPPRTPLSASDFRPSGPRDVATQLAAALPNANERATFIKVCQEIVSTIEAAPEFRRNNLASALTLLIGASLQALSGRELDDAATEGLLRLINDDLAETKLLPQLSAGQATRAYDTMLIIGGLILGLDANARETGNAEMKAQARELATGALASLGLSSLTASPAADRLGSPTAAAPDAWGLWRYKAPDGQVTQRPEVLGWQLVQGRSFCQFALYAAVRGDGSAVADFAAEWAQLSGARGAPSAVPPASSAQAPNGWTRIDVERDEQSSAVGKYRVRQVTFSGHSQRMSAVVTGNDPALCQPRGDAFLTSLIPLRPAGS